MLLPLLLLYRRFEEEVVSRQLGVAREHLLVLLVAPAVLVAVVAVVLGYLLAEAGWKDLLAVAEVSVVVFVEVVVAAAEWSYHPRRCDLGPCIGR